MCGRFAQYSDYDSIARHFNIDNKIRFTPSYNITPSNLILAIVNDNHDYKLIKLRWGFIPSWTKDDGNPRGFINARAETIQNKPSFRSAFKYRRCLIIANGFYEWKTVGRYKEPYYIHCAQNPLIGFAGIWAHWHRPDATVVWTCAIITQASYNHLQQLHDRTPVIVPKTHYHDWLNTDVGNTQIAEEILSFHATPALTFHRVNKQVNSPYFNNPTCIQPIDDS